MSAQFRALLRPRNIRKQSNVREDEISYNNIRDYMQKLNLCVYRTFMLVIDVSGISSKADKCSSADRTREYILLF